MPWSLWMIYFSGLFGVVFLMTVSFYITEKRLNLFLANRVAGVFSSQAPTAYQNQWAEKEEKELKR
jgi:hypothetical protein